MSSQWDAVSPPEEGDRAGGGRASGAAGRPVLGAALVLGAATLWGSLGLFGKLLFQHHLVPVEVASARAAIAFITLAAVMAPRWQRLVPSWRELPLFALYGAISIGLFYYLYLEAIERTTLAIAAALLYTAPGFVLVLSWALRWEPVRPGQLLPLAMTLTGAFLVTGAATSLVAGGASLPPGAVLAGLGSGLTYALFTVLGKRVAQRTDLARVIFWAYGFGALVLGINVRPWRPFLDAPAAAPLLVTMAIGPTLLATVLFLAGVRYIQASSASMLATIEPVVAALLGAVLLEETLGADTALGTTLVIGAALLLARRGRRRTGFD